MKTIMARGIFFISLLILGLSGCSALWTTRKDNPAPQPFRPEATSRATYHYAAGILLALNENADGAIREMEEARRLDPGSPYLAKELAALYTEKGDTDKALALCQTTLEEHPNDIDTRILLAGIYLNQKEFQKAASQYRRIVELDPKNTAAYFYLGTSLAELKKLDEAATALQGLVQIDPDHFMGNYYLAKLLFDLKRYDDAEAGFKKTLALRPQFEAALLDLARLYETVEKIPQAIEVFKDFIGRHPGRIQAQIKLGELFLRTQNYEQAEASFQEVLKIDKTNREVRLTLGLIYLEQGLHEKGVAVFTSLLQEFPSEFKLMYLLGTTHESMKAPEKALDTLRGIPPTSEHFGNAQIRIGMILKKLGRTEEAIASLQGAIEKKNDAPGLYAYLAALYEDGKRFVPAEEILRKGLGITPGSPDLHFALGVLFEKTDRFEESILSMQAVLRLDQDHAEALNFIGYMYADRGVRLDEAEEMIKKALLLKPGNAYMTDSLGWVYFRKNKLEEAIKHLKDASRSLPEDPAILEHLGDAYEKSGMTREAIEAYEQALKFAPEKGESLRKKLDRLLGR